MEGVPSAAAAARDACDAVLRDRGMRQVAAEDSATALLAGARASAAMEPDGDRWLPGTGRLSTELIELGGLVLTSPGQVLARAHTLLAHGLVPVADLGRVRADAEAADRLVGLNELLVRTTSAPSIVLAAVVHGEIASIAPFGAGDGILARAMEHLVLIATGIDPRAVILCEAGHQASGAGYGHALAGYQQGTPNGVRGWLLHCAQTLSYGAEMSPLAGRRLRSPRRP